MTRRAAGAYDEDLVGLYLRNIASHELLTRADEEQLGRAIEAGREAAVQLARDVELPAERREHLEELVAEAERATERFVQANLRLVVSVAKRYRSSQLSLLDLVQEGNLGLMHAVEKFDFRKGFKFSTYATWWIRQAITRAIANNGRTIRLPVHMGATVTQVHRAQAALEAELGRAPAIEAVAQELHMSPEKVAEAVQAAAEPVSLSTPRGEDGDIELGEVIEDGQAATPFDEVVAAMVPAQIAELLGSLDDREREVICLRYGLDRGEPRTLDDVGRVIGVTRERVRQLERRAVAKLRRCSAERGLEELLVG